MKLFDVTGILCIDVAEIHGRNTQLPFISYNQSEIDIFIYTKASWCFAPKKNDFRSPTVKESYLDNSLQNSIELTPTYLEFESVVIYSL